MAGKTGGVIASFVSQWDDSGVRAARRDIDRFEQQTKQSQGAFGKFGDAVKGVGLAIAGAFSVGVVVDFLKDSAAAAIEDEKSMVALAKAMENVGQGFANADAESFIKDMMLATGVADDQLRPAMQALVTATGDATKSQDLLQTALDVSTATGKDLTTVATALSKAYNGNIGALTRLGVPMDAAIVKSKDFGAAVDQLNEKFGGQAAAAANTYGGRLKRVQTAAAEAQETIGYALLGAIEDVSAAFGGTDGAVDAFTGFGDATANFITGVGLMATEVAKLTAAITANQDEGTNWGDRIQTWAHALDAINPVFSNVVDSIVLATDAGNAQTVVAEAQARAIDALGARYTGLAASIDPAKAAMLGVSDAADDAAAALDEMKASFDAVTGAMSTQDKMDAYRLAVMKIKESIDDTSRSLGVNSEAGLKNRDVIRQVFDDAKAAALAWGEQNGKTTDEVQQRFASMTSKIRQNLIDQGFKPQDIDKFLGGLGLWTSQTQVLANGLSTGAAAAAMRLTGQAFADATKDGFDASMRPGGRAFEAMSARMTALAQSLTREATVTVTTVNRSVSESRTPVETRATGGPVTAGQPYIVGDGGRPELFVPSTDGVILPRVPSASSGSPAARTNTYNITVQAGVGDPRQIGQQVVQYIKRFEQANGPVFAAA